MICIAALIIFGLLGIFSLKYRRLAKEALSCVLRRVTFRPCETQFSEKIRMGIVSGVFKRSEKGAAFLNRTFEIWSFLFVLLFLASTVLAGKGLYNLWRYKTCDLKNPANCPIGAKSCQVKEKPKEEKVKGAFSEKPYKKGEDSAPIKIEEFSDFQCPACRLAFGVNGPVFSQYQDKIQIIFRHFPLPNHRNAMKAAQAAEAAGNQSKFWEYHDLLFEKQDEWSKTSNPTSLFVNYAKSLELDEKKFREDLNSKEIKEKIEGDYKAGQNAGINATPTFIINGFPQVGVMAPEKLRQIIEEELKKN